MKRMKEGAVMPIKKRPGGRGHDITKGVKLGFKPARNCESGLIAGGKICLEEEKEWF